MSTITFIDSAYPKPHLLEEFVWAGRLDESGKLWFDLHLKSKYYYLSEGEEYIEDEEEDFDDDAEYTSMSEWQYRIVWDNYHQCTLSSTYWSDEGGLLLSDGTTPFSFDLLDNREFVLNPLPLADDMLESELAFGIYLLGHDLSANHTISFTPLANKHYAIQWSGVVALAYGGFYDYIHEFKADITESKFDGFYFPTTWTLEEAKKRFEQVLSNIDQYEFIDINPKSNKREYKLMLKE
ncbi:hypothetical protein VSP10_11935 [Myroides odoratimimus]|uniref:hypothetical protein n=1 Tax=Myroides odoratimimus TaxID=76832 RepID=UPI002DB7249B|nr:hypothetical protein [Myroides odoratimimus]MEC4053495.1 hypothetical protein [Myroides odoratimimus]